MTLFQSGLVALHSGGASDFKIDCDALTDADIETLAAQAAKCLPAFAAVEGVPSGGLRFAQALRRYQRQTGVLLIADDVLTTGTSIEKQRAGRDATGIVLFARGPCPLWVLACFRLALVPHGRDGEAH